jgi:hypothetical protein
VPIEAVRTAVSENDTIYQDRIARRERLVKWISLPCFGITTFGLYFYLLFHRPRVLEGMGFQPGHIDTLAFVPSLLFGVLTMVGVGYAVEVVHCSLWPEHPDKE